MSKGLMGIAESVQPEVFQAVLHLSLELAEKGREGKPIGTIFVVGDTEKVLPLTKQMIINPFRDTRKNTGTSLTQNSGRPYKSSPL